MQQLPVLRVSVLLVLHALIMVAAASAPKPVNCPCQNPEWCKPVRTYHKKEVFGFSVVETEHYGYDWTQLTTAAWNKDPKLMCLAHSKDARVVLDARTANSPSVYANATARALWLKAHLQEALDNFMDGTNFDLEDPLDVSSPLAAEYSQLVQETADLFHAAIPGSQISVDVPWSPYGIDGRNYDWISLAKAADVLFVMAYDMQSQIWGKCVASANSPPELVRRGVQQWLELGIPADKLVLGLPWYGYRYPCTNQAFMAGMEDICRIPEVSFRGCSCSDAAGQQFCFGDIQKMMAVEPSSLGQYQGVSCEQAQWDSTQFSPYMRCRNTTGPEVYQVWFDTTESLILKYKLAVELGLRGVGMWNLDCLDYECTEPACRKGTTDMWAALRAFASHAPDSITLKE